MQGRRVLRVSLVGCVCTGVAYVSVSARGGEGVTLWGGGSRSGEGSERVAW
jgi:hypothetical protein